MSQPEMLLNPTGDGDASADTRLAPRLRSLSGLRVGLLDNTKPNSSVLLAAVAHELRHHWGVRSATRYAKGYFGTPVEESQIRVIRESCDFVVAGIGD